MGETFYINSPSPDALPCAYQPGQPAPSLSGKAYVTANCEHKIFRIAQIGFKNCFLIPAVKKNNKKVSIYLIVVIDYTDTLQKPYDDAVNVEYQSYHRR